AREDHGVPEHDRADVVAGRGVGLVLEPTQDHTDQRADAEVVRPRVGPAEPKLRQVVLYARQQPRVVAAAALAVLAAVGIPAVRRERTVPTVGLLMAGHEEGLHGLVSGSSPPGAVQVDE